MRYDAIEASPERFRDSLATFAAHGGRGANVTLPFKLEAVKVANALTIRAQAAGAVHAGKVEVAFVNPASYTDIGAGAAEEDANLRQIDRYLRLTAP